MNWKDLFKPRKTELQRYYYSKLLESLGCINEYQSMVADSVINQWPIEKLQVRYMRSYLNYEVPNIIDFAKQHSSSDLLHHVEKRRYDLIRLNDLLERSEK
jgi:hypothetical protein